MCGQSTHGHGICSRHNRDVFGWRQLEQFTHSVYTLDLKPQYMGCVAVHNRYFRLRNASNKPDCSTNSTTFTHLYATSTLCTRLESSTHPSVSVEPDLYCIVVFTPDAYYILRTHPSSVFIPLYLFRRLTKISHTPNNPVAFRSVFGPAVWTC